MLSGRRILLIISGGIAAYKSLDLIRRLREQGAAVRCVLTESATQFVTPLSVAALSEHKVYQDLFSLTDEAEMGHIRLSREADLVVVAPASANLIAKMACGLADDLASTALLATDKPVLIAPAMNVFMWNHPATQGNVAALAARGVHRVGPGAGELACGEVGEGRMADVPEIMAAIGRLIGVLPPEAKPLAGRRAIVTSGPTHEPIDPVRFIANRSSGKQGHAVAAALHRLGAEVTLVSGPVTLPPPEGVEIVPVETAAQMLEACLAALPADIAVCAAAVADWRVSNPGAQKHKKTEGGGPPTIALTPNPDILATLSQPGELRPALVVGFAAETELLLQHASAKLARKGCDWIVANDVSPASGTFGGDQNAVHLLTPDTVEAWPRMGKELVAERLAERIAAHFAKPHPTTSEVPA
ncbi:bifunctional phosphopantothenoylcysteine decarboxylase/phosphopantothenate--cysteine ligase CoaBC [Telmatospirillum sp. J64-1]|uniref:bifunctional phosphopantothenoylcysteine decarboxylase/phosphopantothenate--cysteine ligase CoaBC n=1 Tax=Telmatospirillum sp. J64-1 TaxID=2502183 RepID=UPI001C8F371B|nr:bifunctional phosphopantothenoylcysteine decarboxylase/phosphopantothenate--cysteine ligase CoaBC [Telmatospirillum sp. J64-1]